MREASWQFPTKNLVNKRCESGPIRMSFVVDRKVFVDHELCTTAWSKQWRRWGFIVSKSRPFSFAIGLSEVFDRPNASQRRQRWESSPAESLCEIYVRSRIRNRPVVQKLQRGVKVTDILDGFRVARLTWLNLLSFLPGAFSDALKWSTCVWIACVCFGCLAAD